MLSSVLYYQQYLLIKGSGRLTGEEAMEVVPAGGRDGFLVMTAGGGDEAEDFLIGLGEDGVDMVRLGGEEEAYEVSPLGLLQAFGPSL